MGPNVTCFDMEEDSLTTYLIQILLPLLLSTLALFNRALKHFH